MIQQCFIVSPKVKDAKEDFGAVLQHNAKHTHKAITTKSHGLKQGSSASFHFSAWLQWDQKQQTFSFFPPLFLAKLTLKSSL